MSNIKTNVLSIYLIKKDYSNHKKILKDPKGYESKVLNIGTFYYTNSVSDKGPSWRKTFFGDSLGKIDLKVNSIKGVLLISINTEQDEGKRIFAVTFGHGRTMIKQEAYEEGFGLKIVLNSIGENNIRQIEKSSLSAPPKNVIEHLTKVGPVKDFRIDFDQDLIRSVTGKSEEDGFGNMIAGKDSLRISEKVDIKTISEFLEKCYEIYQRDTYKTNFNWIDQQFSEIKNSIKIDELDKNFITKLNQIISNGNNF